MRHPLSVEAFADWVKRQPRDQEYEYGKCQGCAYYQYLKWAGIDVWSVGDDYWRHRDNMNKKHPIPLAIDRAVCMGRWTYGALADRLALGTDKGT